LSLQRATIQHSFTSDIRYFMLHHEVSFGLYGASTILICAYFFPLWITYPIVLSLLASLIFIHPRAIGIIPNALDQHFLSTAFRGLLFGFCYGYLNGDYQFSVLHAFGLLIPLLAGTIYWFGFFAEFMHRRGFSDWIIMICTSMLAMMYFFFIIKEQPEPLFVSIIFSASILATGMRLRSKTVWDAILVLLFLYIITHNAPYLLLLFRTFG